MKRTKLSVTISATIALSAALITPAGAMTQAFAAPAQAQGASQAQAQHQLPILKVTPTNGATTVRPDAPIQIVLDPSANTFNRFHEQFVKGSFQVTLNGTPVTATYDDSTYTVTVHNDTLTRYTTYTVGIALKASLNSNGNSASNNANDSFSFTTGSAIGEATHVTATVATPNVTVISGGTLTVSAADDYGDAATNATVTVTGNGPGNARVPSAFTAAATTGITSGTASVALDDHSAETVALQYTVTDNVYHDTEDTTSGSASETFLPGPVQQIHVVNPDKIVAGQSYTFSGDAEDVYGNSVTDGSQLNLTASAGTVDSSASTTAGNYSFAFTAPSKAGADAVTVASADSGYSTSDPFTVIHAAPSKATITLPTTLQTGQPASVSGTLSDQYGNPVDGTALTFTGALTGTLTTDNNGNYSGTLTVGSSGPVTVTGGGQSIALTTPTGQAVSTVSVTSGSTGGATYKVPSGVTTFPRIFSGWNGEVPIGEAVDPKGNLWFLTTLETYEYQNGKWVNKWDPNGWVERNQYNANWRSGKILFDSQGNLYVARHDEGFEILNASTGKWTVPASGFNYSDWQNPLMHVNDMALDSNQTLYLATTSGLFTYKDGVRTNLNFPDKANCPTNVWIDKATNLPVVSNAVGYWKMNADGTFTKIVPVGALWSNGAYDPNTETIYVIVGTNVVKYQEVNGTWQQTQTVDWSKKFQYLNTPVLHSTTVDSSGNLYVVDAYNNVGELKDGVWQRLPYPYLGQMWQGGHLDVDSNGVLWMAARDSGLNSCLLAYNLN